MAYYKRLLSPDAKIRSEAVSDLTSGLATRFVWVVGVCCVCARGCDVQGGQLLTEYV
jgi:hypothetical protein